MSTHISLEGALEKARIKRKVSNDLAELSFSARRDILIDLLAALEEEEAEKSGTNANLPAVPSEQNRRSVPRLIRSERHGDPSIAVNGADDSHRKTVLRLLSASPGLPIKMLALN